MTGRAVAFVATAEAQRALAFYRDVLGLTLQEDTPFAIVFDAHGTMLRFKKRRRSCGRPTRASASTWMTSKRRREGFWRRALKVRYPQFEQDELGIWSAPGGAKVFWFHDPDGNLLSLSQF